ncbi:MAG: hypothetical protein CL868_02950 [Cytophagaceae bacterium]|nr:hypothetical protein [Cytophagaceae bacterium]|tara:strand:+ start:2090 stop:3301 length:1212 start_codon:yes stop_codon:yes gene_type:complete
MQLKSSIALVILLINLVVILLWPQDHEQEQEVRQLEEQTHVAGDEIVLRFREIPSGATLFIRGGHGSTLLFPEEKDNKIQFTLPPVYAQKKGQLSYDLIASDKVVMSGKISIKPNENNVERMEAYLGPSSITAGGGDFTQLVAMPVDNYDNTLFDGTPVTVRTQFKGQENSISLSTAHGFVHQDIFSPLEDGKLLVSAVSNGTSSTGMITKVYPHLATGFSIFAERPHKYADGDQITLLKTSIIKDRYGNIVSDGTQVEFMIQDSDSTLYRAVGSTINGMATTQVNHPRAATTLTIKAGISGIAESAPLVVDYLAAVNNFEYRLRERTLTVGPVHAFMGQRIPQGTPIHLKLQGANGEYVVTKYADDGMATFVLPVEQVAAGTWEINIMVLGKVQSKMINIAE